MILCLDVGNSQIAAAVFDGEDLRVHFRLATHGKPTSDELGIFLRSALRENGFEFAAITAVALCSTVPDLVHSLRNACLKYFELDPFILGPGMKTGLKIRYRDPREVGPDRIADAIAAVDQFPDQDLIVIDFGTATTIEVISRDRSYQGGAILPGVRLAMEALETKTAKLPSVAIVQPATALGRSTSESMQSGLYYGTLGGIRLLVQQISTEAFGDRAPMVLATGGFSSLFRDEKDFDHIIPHLTLHGLRLALALNA